MILKLSVLPEADEPPNRADGAASRPDPIYGYQLQDLAIQGHDAEEHIGIDYEEVPAVRGDGTRLSLRKPAYSITDLGYGPLHPNVAISPRVAPQMIGLGLLEAIPEDAVRAAPIRTIRTATASPGGRNEVAIWHSHDTVSRALGRFGWKAGAPAIRQQAMVAFASDMGLSSRHNPAPWGDCTRAQERCQLAPSGASERQGGREVADELFDLAVFYAQNLAVPARRGHDRPEVLEGKARFHELGCAACHRPSFTTGEVAGQPHLSHRKIWPYTDLLLHDMGEGLALRAPIGQALSTEDLAKKSVAVQGFTAFDVVGFGPGSDALANSASPNSPRCQYAGAIAANISRMAREVHAAWTGYAGFARIWLEPGGGNRVFLDAKETTRALVRAYLDGLERTRDIRLAGPLGFKDRRLRPLEPPFPHSGLAVPLIAANVEGLRALLTQSGFLDAALVASHAAEADETSSILETVAGELDQAAQSLKAAARLSPQPFENAEAREKLVAAGFPLNNARATGGAYLSQAADLGIGLNAGDGD